MSVLDFVIVGLYLAVVQFVGWWFGRGERNSADYIVGGRQVPWLFVLGSVIATEISAVTFLGAPGEGFSSDFSYVQVFFGSIIGRVFIGVILITAFYKADCLTIYQYLAKRFGGQSSVTAALYFLVTRLLASGVRLMLAAVGFSFITGYPFLPCVIFFAVASLLYAGKGGIRSVIYTDCVQAVVFLGAGVVALVFILQQVGWENYLTIAGEGGKWSLFHWSPDSEKGWLNDGNWIVIAMLMGALTTMANMGVDQDLTQRMLSCPDVRQARRSIIASSFLALPALLLFMLIGVGLFVYYELWADPNLPMKDGKVWADRVFPYFIGEVMPGWVRGLLIAGVFAAAMSSLDSAMAALSSSVVVDLYRPFFGQEQSEAQMLRISRLATAVFAGLLVLVAWFMKDQDNAIWLGLRITAFTYGPLLGIFLVATLTRRGSDRGNVVAMLMGTGLAVFYFCCNESSWFPAVAWHWWFVGILLATMALALVFKPDQPASTPASDQVS